jgi:DNA-binding response OmpR family regulator
MNQSWYVDDDQDMIQAMTMVLSLLEIEVRPFFTARAAVRAFEKGERPELLILDINMPEVTGIDLLEYMRRDSAYDDMPIIMLSSEHTDVQVHEALNKGADGYAMKPVTVDELERVIDRAFEARKARNTN